jgi:hypothetical protein
VDSFPGRTAELPVKGELLELRRRDIAQGAVRAEAIVVDAPRLDSVLRLRQAEEPVFVEALVAEPAVEALDVGILGRLNILGVIAVSAFRLLLRQRIVSFRQQDRTRGDPPKISLGSESNMVSQGGLNVKISAIFRLLALLVFILATVRVTAVSVPMTPFGLALWCASTLVP